MKTHYDVLNLEKNCSAQEIKDSFIALSKKYHPDKNKSSDAHKKFVEVNEAYAVLGKSNLRNRYDESLSYKSQRVVYNHSYSSHYNKTPFEHYAEMCANNLRRNQESSRGYFTTSKLTAAIFCCILMMFGSGIQLIAESHRRARHSEEIARFLREAKKSKNKVGKEQAIKDLEEMLLNRQNENKKHGKQ